MTAVCEPQATLLAEYTPPDFLITATYLCFELDAKATRVTANLTIKKNGKHSTLHLDGEGLTLQSITLDGELLSSAAYQLTADQLVISHVPDNFSLCIVTEISPATNTSLMGLYSTNDVFCTQCEAEGFRKITYYLDRPDVLAEFTTKIIADKIQYPVLLSNGNSIEQGDCDDGKHFAVWHDPFPKPCYLFALVAGQLDFIEDTFTTMSGRKVALRIYTESQNINQCDHAMSSIKKAMRWDEEHYGREYDLSIFMVVAVNDFNFGAMENKGLNIFNAKYVLARPETATDTDFANIDTVVAHEYFHNWSGDRVTLRDWFQISLKEGFTVYREQSFDEDHISKVVHRINMVNQLRNGQFPEDAGPMAHAIRPDSYIKIDNFYTITVYNKGGEVIRMFNTLLGDKNYRAATDDYFERFDGQAVTTDDFAGSMQRHCDLDLTSFLLWYKQAGTPELTVTDAYDADKQQYTLRIKQHVPDTPGQTNKKPMMLPLKIALFDADGNKQALGDLLHGDILVVDQAEQVFVFKNILKPVTPSLLRHFSAPVKLNYEYSLEQLVFLLKHDDDGFNRWESGQKLMLHYLLECVQQIQSKSELRLDDSFLHVIAQVFDDNVADKLFHSQLLSLPSEQYVAEQMTVVDVDAIYQARQFVKFKIAKHLENKLLAIYLALSDASAYRYHVADMGKRKLRNTCLSYLLAIGDEQYLDLAMEQFKTSLSTNMTDCLAALALLSNTDSLQRVEALSLFYDKWQAEPLVVNKWLAAQAASSLPGTLSAIKSLMQQDCFNIANPNNVYSVLNTFANQSLINFHDKSGDAYCFIADRVLELDQINPMVAARIVSPLSHWKRYDSQRQELMKGQLQRIIGHKNLSKNVYEYVEKSLNF